MHKVVAWLPNPIPILVELPQGGEQSTADLSRQPRKCGEKATKETEKVKIVHSEIIYKCDGV